LVVTGRRFEKAAPFRFRACFVLFIEPFFFEGNSDMNKVFMFGILAAAVALLAMGSASAQTASYGAIKGVVTNIEPDSIPLPGVVITVVFERTGMRWEAVSDAEGEFSFGQLAGGGPYRLTAELEGFQTPSKDGFYLKLGETTDFAIQMSLEGAEDPVVVVVGADR
jgi:hypothetical protein